MNYLICKICGGTLAPTSDASVAQCEFCGRMQPVPKFDSEKKMAMYEEADRLRFRCDFDRAQVLYTQIISEFPQESEALWGLLLCKYGVEYVDDPRSHTKIPTLHRLSYDSVPEDEYYKRAVENADFNAAGLYRQYAREIEAVRRRVLEVASHEKPYDIFISYKETDAMGFRTEDSQIAESIYSKLISRGYRVFFSRVTLNEKLGSEYEPLIFSALYSSRMMILVGTREEYVSAIWVKNEWSRFLEQRTKDISKSIIVCYRNIKPEQFPPELQQLQLLDMNMPEAKDILLSNVQRVIAPKKQNTAARRVSQAENAQYDRIESLLKRAFMFAEDGDFVNAEKYFDNVLDTAPENGDAYIGKLLCDYKVRRLEELQNLTEDIRGNANYKRAMRFGTYEEQSFIIKAARTSSYNFGIALQRHDAPESLQKAAEQFRFAGDLYDARQRMAQCQSRMQQLQYTEGVNNYRQQLQKQKEALYQEMNKSKVQVEWGQSFTIAILSAVSGGLLLAASFWLLNVPGSSFLSLLKIAMFFTFPLAAIALVVALIQVINIIRCTVLSANAKNKTKDIRAQIQAIDNELARLPQQPKQ